MGNQLAAGIHVMDSAQAMLVNSVRAAFKRQQLLTANLTANAFLGFVIYSWFVLNGSSSKDIINSVLVLAPTAVLLCWLQAATFATFHPGVKEVPYLPVLRRLHYFAPWAVGVAGLVFLFAWISSLLGVWVWIIGAACLFALLPLLSQAAGGRFSRPAAIEVIFSQRYWFAVTCLLVVTYLPSALLLMLSSVDSFLLRAMLRGLQVGVTYLLGILSWVTLAAVISNLAAGEEAALAKGCEVANSGQIVTPNRPLNRSAMPIEKTTNQTSQ